MIGGKIWTCRPDGTLRASSNTRDPVQYRCYGPAVSHRSLPFTFLASLALLGGCALNPGKVAQIVKANDAQPLVRQTRTGLVEGRGTAQGQAYLGIPYAAPPMGALRFAAPMPVAAWHGVRPAVAVGHACGGRHEDCLTLNVYAPHEAAPGRTRPVMVWLYGGAFKLGSNAQYDLSALAERQGVVVVAPNYRLGALGFLAHPALAGDGEGDYSLLDQVAALRWVRDNVAGFGGDPAAVTLFGESAGAWSACTLMAAPRAKGLFARAILQSDPCVGKNSTVDRTMAERAGREIAAKLGCDDDATALTCLRALPARRIAGVKSRRTGLSMKDGWSPMHGGDVVPLSPAAALAAGRFDAVPMIQGTNAREGTLFSWLFTLSGKLLTEGQLRRTLATSFPGDEAAIWREYGDAARASRWQATGRLVTDAIFACPAWRMNRALAARRVPVWAYEFDDPDAPFGPPRFFQPKLGAYHSSEIAYVFQRRWAISGRLRFTPDQHAFSDRIQDYWGRFARTGDPNGKDAPIWSNFAAGAEPYRLAVTDHDRHRAFSATHHCGFWNKLGY